MPDQHSTFPSGHRGVVHNSVSGSVGGMVIQAADIQGDLRFDSGPGGPAVIQSGPHNIIGGGQPAVELTAQLAEEIELYLEQMSGSDLGQRSARAADLLEQLRTSIPR